MNQKPTTPFYGKFKAAIIADELTTSCLGPQLSFQHVTPLNYKWLLRLRKPDFLFVESAWHGHNNRWKYKVAYYPDHPHRNNSKLKAVINYAKEKGIPTVFWNKEDGVHFERFIDSARLFDHVFTVDSNCIDRYRKLLPEGVTVSTLIFPVQPATHLFTGFNFKHYRANFVGSYSHHVHDRRRVWQDMLFQAASGIGLTAFDRNSGRKSEVYRYPPLRNLEVRPAVPHAATAQIYKDYLVSLNVNTVEDSPTMFSRRLVEILACGGIAVTTPAKSVDALFKDYCHVVSSGEEAFELFERLRHGPSSQDLERARAGAEYVLREHTWAKRLEYVMDVVQGRTA